MPSSRFLDPSPDSWCPRATDTPPCQSDNVLAHLHEARRSIADHLASADPDRVTTAQAVEALEVFAELERLVHAGQVLYARRATEGTAWRDEGHRSSASWMAEKTRTGMGEAIGVLEASDFFFNVPATTE